MIQVGGPEGLCTCAGFRTPWQPQTSAVQSGSLPCALPPTSTGGRCGASQLRAAVASSGVAALPLRPGRGQRLLLFFFTIRPQSLLFFPNEWERTLLPWEFRLARER